MSRNADTKTWNNSSATCEHRAAKRPRLYFVTVHFDLSVNQKRARGQFHKTRVMHGPVSACCSRGVPSPAVMSCSVSAGECRDVVLLGIRTDCDVSSPPCQSPFLSQRFHPPAPPCLLTLKETTKITTARISIRIISCSACFGSYCVSPKIRPNQKQRTGMMFQVDCDINLIPK